MQTKYTAQDLADRITRDTQEQLRLDKLDCQANLDMAHGIVKEGKKYTKVDQGRLDGSSQSGKYMIDAEGNIFGIKGYGVIHRGHRFGTLDTIDQYNWGGHRARKIK